MECPEWKLSQVWESFRSPSPPPFHLCTLRAFVRKSARDPWIRLPLLLRLSRLLPPFPIFFERQTFFPRFFEFSKENQTRDRFFCIAVGIVRYSSREGEIIRKYQLAEGCQGAWIYISIISFPLINCRNNFTLLFGHSFSSLDPVHPCSDPSSIPLSFLLSPLPSLEPRRRQPVPLPGY